MERSIGDEPAGDAAGTGPPVTLLADAYRAYPREPPRVPHPPVANERSGDAGAAGRASAGRAAPAADQPDSDAQARWILMQASSSRSVASA